MPEGITAENIFENIVETLSDSKSEKKKSVSFFEEKPNLVSSQINGLFGRQKPVHHLLGGGKCKIVYSFFFLLSYSQRRLCSFLKY